MIRSNLSAVVVCAVAGAGLLAVAQPPTTTPPRPAPAPAPAPTNPAPTQPGPAPTFPGGGGRVQPPAGGVLASKDVGLNEARAIIDAARQRAEQLHVAMNIAVVDAGGNLKAFERMDGAWLGSIDIAEKKARTARFFNMNTGDIGKLSQPGQPLYGIEVTNGGLVTFPGGILLRSADGTIIGGIGVSGSTVENDQTVAQAGAAAVGGAAATTPATTHPTTTPPR